MKEIMFIGLGMFILLVIGGIVFTPATSGCNTWQCIQLIPELLETLLSNSIWNDDLYIAGDLTVGGSAPTSSVPFAETYICPTSSIVALAVSSQWYNITDNWIAGESYLITPINDNVTLQVTNGGGVYKVGYSLSFDSGAKESILTTIRINDNQYCEGCQSLTYISTPNQPTNIGTSCLLTLNQNDNVTLVIQSPTGTPTLEVYKTNLNLFKMGEIP